MKRTVADLEQMLERATFTPFVVTIKDQTGTVLAVTDPRKALIANSMLVMVGADKKLYHIPFKSILYITMAGEDHIEIV